MQSTYSMCFPTILLYYQFHNKEPFLKVWLTPNSPVSRNKSLYVYFGMHVSWGNNQRDHAFMHRAQHLQKVMLISIFGVFFLQISQYLCQQIIQHLCTCHHVILQGRCSSKTRRVVPLGTITALCTSQQIKTYYEWPKCQSASVHWDNARNARFQVQPFNRFCVCFYEVKNLEVA